MIGSKGIPGRYGGYETFMDKLTEYHEHKESLTYHVACKAGGKDGLSSDVEEYEYHGARCFPVKVPDIGPAQAIYYDIAAFRQALAYIRSNNIPKPVVYILACRIGPFTASLARKLHALGGTLYINPDGHEWQRGKWSAPVRKYWKYSEKGMVKHADLVICDSRHMESYIREEYAAFSPKTTYISYGAESGSVSDGNGSTEEKLKEWLSAHELAPGGYYLIVGRFVPENNFETMLREFMLSKTKRKLAVITTANDKLLKKLEEKYHIQSDPRINFTGTVYDAALLKRIREEAFSYLHGHEVGGTNPSLLEAMGSTALNLLYDVGFNREVGEDAALYWTKEPGNLAALLDRSDAMAPEEREAFGERAKKRIKEHYSWELIAAEYEKLFLKERT